jgi:hypothetical protein
MSYRRMRLLDGIESTERFESPSSEELSMSKENALPNASVDSIVLLPCPFCGTKARWIERLHSSGRFAGYDIGCNGYDCMAADGFDWVMDEFNVAEMWNRRATPELICRKCSLRQDAQPKTEPQF